MKIQTLTEWKTVGISTTLERFTFEQGILTGVARKKLRRLSGFPRPAGVSLGLHFPARTVGNYLDDEAVAELHEGQTSAGLSNVGWEH